MSFFEKIQKYLSSQKSNHLSDATTQISESYRQTSKAVLTQQNAHAYALTRMPATYSVMRHVLSQLPESFTPHSILDVGCGPGTATLAALDFFKHSFEITLEDNQPTVLNMAHTFMTHLNVPYQTHGTTTSDLVMASYVLGEIEGLEKFLSKLWQRCTNTLIITLPGTPRDFTKLMQARNYLITQGAFIGAPCTHQFACPLAPVGPPVGLAPKDWCHFSVRVPRSAQHRRLKEATLSFEDEKFCYLIATRAPIEQDKNTRIIKRPIPRPGHVILDVCNEHGKLERTIIPKSNPNYKRMRKKEWGDLMGESAKEI